MARALLIVDHGSRLADANAVLDSVAEAVRRRRADLHVEVAHMELAGPSLAEALGRCAERAEEVVVVPYFLGPGRHTRRDIPRLVEEARRAHPGVHVRIGEPLGFDERLVDVVLDRADDVG